MPGWHHSLYFVDLTSLLSIFFQHLTIHSISQVYPKVDAHILPQLHTKDFPRMRHCIVEPGSTFERGYWRAIAKPSWIGQVMPELGTMDQTVWLWRRWPWPEQPSRTRRKNWEEYIMSKLSANILQSKLENYSKPQQPWGHFYTCYFWKKINISSHFAM